MDDALREMPVSPDPMAPALQALLAGVKVGTPETCTDQLRPILSNAAIFGVDLYQAGLGEKNRSRVPGHAGGPRRGPYHSAPVFE